MSDTDSIFVSYSDFSTYEILNSGFNFSNTDSLSEFHLKGNTTKTMYEKYSKNDFGIAGDFSIKNGIYKFGGLLSNNYSSNSSVTRPTSNSTIIMPLAGFSVNGLNFETAAGYVGKVDEIDEKRGQGVSVKGNYIFKDGLNDISLNSGLTADNTDDDINYNNSSQVSYLKLFEGEFGNFTLNGSNNIHQYHFSDFSGNSFRVNRYEYDIKTGFLYIASDNIRNIANLGWYARNKDSHKNDAILSYNSNSDLSLSDEVIFDNKRIMTSFKIDFDTGSDKYSLDYEENDKSLSFYNFSLSSQSNYKWNKYNFGIYGRYFKHEYKSLSNSNLEDRDIIKMSLKPDVNFFLNDKFSVTQSFPLEYYRMMNISSLRSGNNYIDRVVNSVTDIKNQFNDELYITGKIQFRSYFRSYDYDETFSNSFIIKNYSLGDTVSYKFTPLMSAKLSNRYIYEEYGNFNYNSFTENPLTYKSHYYTSLSFLLGIGRYSKFTAEYYFYEIDSYNFDQDDFSKDELTRVYISHGPKFGFDYTLRKFHLFSGIEIDNFRSDDSQIKFRIESSVSFE